MKVTLDISDEMLDKLGISYDISSDDAKNIIMDALDWKIPVEFQVKCKEDIYSKPEGLLYSEGGVYNVAYYNDKILINSNFSDYAGTLLAEDDFMNKFEVCHADLNVARYMYHEGYGDMFFFFFPSREITTDTINDIIHGKALLEYVGNYYECIAVYGERLVFQETVSDYSVELTVNQLINDSNIRAIYPDDSKKDKSDKEKQHQIDI